MKKEEFICDIKECSKTALYKKQSLQVIFHTDQTEGRGTAPYLSQESLDLCQGCMEHILSGNYVHGSGAMGYNEYWFTKSQNP